MVADSDIELFRMWKYCCNRIIKTRLWCLYRKIVDCIDVDLDIVYNKNRNSPKRENRTVFFLKKADNLERGDTRSDW